MIKKDKEKYHLPITVSLRTSPQTGVAIRSPLQRPDAAERMDKTEYYVYILSNKMNTAIYTGITRDLIRRIYEHKHHADPNSYTAKYDITKLVYYESTADVNSAIEREKQIKGWNRKRKNKLVESKNPSWTELYDSILL